jgi:flagellar biosynthesis/type III secretory pathway protein FliH
LPADGCIIETPTGYIRATLSEQLAALRAALREAAARG